MCVMCDHADREFQSPVDTDALYIDGPIVGVNFQASRAGAEQAPSLPIVQTLM